jgi:hypothetical protein
MLEVYRRLPVNGSVVARIREGEKAQDRRFDDHRHAGLKQPPVQREDASPPSGVTGPDDGPRNRSETTMPAVEKTRGATSATPISSSPPL